MFTLKSAKYDFFQTCELCLIKLQNRDSDLPEAAVAVAASAIFLKALYFIKCLNILADFKYVSLLWWVTDCVYILYHYADFSEKLHLWNSKISWKVTVLPTFF